MTTTVNKRVGTVQVANVTPSGLEISYTLPVAGGTTGQKLTVVGTDGQSIELTNSQIRALQRVVTAGRRASRRFVSR